MKDDETKRFMEGAGAGLPLVKIAAEIKVSKTTLINWTVRSLNVSTIASAVQPHGLLRRKKRFLRP